MPSFPSPVRLIAAAAVLAAPLASAQVPPIKPGLWQTESDRSVDGRPAPDMAERMKNLPPAARQQMEAMMKQRGVDVSGGAVRMCLTRESLDQGRWNQVESRCKTEFGARSAASWKWRAVCTQPDSTSDGEAVFHSPESYTVTVQTTAMRKGQPHTMRHVAKMRWLGADCGDVKPLQPGPKR